MHSLHHFYQITDLKIQHSDIFAKKFWLLFSLKMIIKYVDTVLTVNETVFWCMIS